MMEGIRLELTGTGQSPLKTARLYSLLLNTTFERTWLHNLEWWLVAQCLYNRLPVRRSALKPG